MSLKEKLDMISQYSLCDVGQSSSISGSGHNAGVSKGVRCACAATERTRTPFVGHLAGPCELPMNVLIYKHQHL